MTISQFIERCDAYCQAAGVGRTWLSKRLFNDTYRLGDLAADKSDVGVRRLERAVEDLASLEQELQQSGQQGLTPGGSEGAAA